MDVDKLEKLAKLKEIGAITEEEYQRGKKEAMGENIITTNLNLKDNKFGLTDKNYIVLMHLSQYAGLAVPMLGIILPVVFWVMNKDNDPLVDTHGRNILNFNLSLIIYCIICVVLMFVFIGFGLILIPIIFMIVFPVIGAVKASNGEVWKYPFSFKFF
ncbi:MAG: Unknown protein [uncultured Aureispira sp.]|uniref:SHOCT domain-containing protein n=1 Tax=uncultured Aureispira sp. TaxID=1331704 RepID=A0A6S6SGI8_9BACT|nr:MAG: Unknown protein [uncultured Aureispira sp.]